jgi:hypothetical protein
MNPSDGCEICGRKLKRKDRTDWRCDKNHMNIQTHPSYDKAIKKATIQYLNGIRERWGLK